MKSQILETASSFNWVTPTVAFIQDLVNGPHSHFGIPALSGWDKRDIRRLLTAHGVRVWGLMYTLDMETLMFSVPKAQARWAYVVLTRKGVPISYIPDEIVDLPTRKSTCAAKCGNGRKIASTSLLDQVFDFLDRLYAARDPR